VSDLKRSVTFHRDGFGLPTEGNPGRPAKDMLA
jgi:hypothetical protein